MTVDISHLVNIKYGLAIMPWVITLTWHAAWFDQSHHMPSVLTRRPFYMWCVTGHCIIHKGPSTKDVQQMGSGGGVVLNFRTFPDGGRGGGGVVCESSDVRKFLKKSKFQNFKLKLEIIIDRDSNMKPFTYDVCSNLGFGK